MAESKQKKGETAQAKPGKRKKFDGPHKGNKFSPKKKKNEYGAGIHLSKRTAALDEHERVAREAKKLSASILQKTAKSNERKEQVSELFDLLKGKVRSLAMKHDLCRTIQCCFRFGSDSQKSTILNELKEEIVSLCKGKYSCFMVAAFLRHGNTENRITVLRELKGKMRKIGTHSCGAHVADLALQQTTQDSKALKSMRTHLWNEFYGERFAIAVANAKGDISNSSALKSFNNFEPKVQLAVLDDLKRIVMKMADKGLLRYSYVQRLTYAFLQNVENLRNSTGEKAHDFYESTVAAIVPLLSEASLAMISTSEGANSICRVLAMSSAKDRKKILKKWKGHVKNMCVHEYGYLIIITALNVVDDTVTLRKNILSEIENEMTKEELLASITDPMGLCRKMYLYLTIPHEQLSRYFSPVEISLMTPVTGTSKKDPEIRKNEVNNVLKANLESCCTENTVQLIKDKRGSDVLLNVLNRWWNVDLCKAITKAVESEMENILEHPTGQVTIKRALVLDKERNDPAKGSALANDIWALMKPDVKKWIQINRSAFVLNALLEHPSTIDDVKKVLKANISVLKQNQELAAIKIIMKQL